MRRAVVVGLVGLGLSLPLRPGTAAAAEGAAAVVEDASPVVELQAMHAQAQERVAQYNATHDPAHLVEARGLLVRWLGKHRTLYGQSEEALAVRAPIEQQLGQIEAELARVQPAPAPAPATASASAPAPAAAGAPAPPPRPAMTAEQAADLRSSQGLVASGATLLTVGGLTLLAVSLPLYALRDQALERADRQAFHVDEQRFIGRARRRHVGSISTLAIGAALAGSGVAMLAVGGARRARVKRELAIVPALGRGFAGGSVVVRF